MSVMEAALAKAKRLSAEKERNKGPDAGPKDAASSSRRRPPDIAEAPVATPQFARLDVIPAICDKNRILIGAPSDRPHSAVLDAYRILRTRLRSRIGSQDMASFGIVSVGAGEGKSLTSVNLALAFAREKKQNVFLLDLDLRNPTVCSKLGVVPKVEIGSYLANPMSPEDVFFTIGVDNLVLAGGTTGHENSSELLGGNALIAFLEYIRQLDPKALVLVDLPPLLLSADALVVAPHLTTTLLVVSQGVTRREHLGRVAEVLAGINVAGVVLNRSSEAAEDYYG